MTRGQHRRADGEPPAWMPRLDYARGAVSRRCSRVTARRPSATVARTRWADDFGNETWTYGVERSWLEEMVALLGGGVRLARAGGRDQRLPAVPGRARRGAYPLRPRAGERPVTDAPDPHARVAVDVLGLEGRDRAARRSSRLRRRSGRCVRRGRPLAAGIRVLRSASHDRRRSAPRRGAVGAADGDVLGYERFAAAGGDWGAIVTAELGHAHSEHVLGVYLTLPMIPGVNLRDVARGRVRRGRGVDVAALARGATRRS